MTHIPEEMKERVRLELAAVSERSKQTESYKTGKRLEDEFRAAALALTEASSVEEHERVIQLRAEAAEARSLHLIESERLMQAKVEQLLQWTEVILDSEDERRDW